MPIGDAWLHPHQQRRLQPRGQHLRLAQAAGRGRRRPRHSGLSPSAPALLPRDVLSRESSSQTISRCCLNLSAPNRHSTMQLALDRAARTKKLSSRKASSGACMRTAPVRTPSKRAPRRPDRTGALSSAAGPCRRDRNHPRVACAGEPWRGFQGHAGEHSRLRDGWLLRLRDLDLEVI